MNLPVPKQEELIRKAMGLASETAAKGNLPFAALLVDEEGSVIIEAVNTVNSTKNAAAHAEINLLFQASQTLGANDLSDYAIVSNAASCPMCTTALIKAKITNFYYGAPNESSMVPNITMTDIIAKTPFSIKVRAGILADQCAEQVRNLAKGAILKPMIAKAGLLLFRGAGTEKELLFVRAYDKPHYILPGGKQEKGETMKAALIRELQEELQVGVKNVQNVGTVEGTTPDGRPLQLHLFSGSIVGEPVPSAEIEETRWMSRNLAAQHSENMTPMSLNHLFPFLAENKLW